MFGCLFNWPRSKDALVKLYQRKIDKLLIKRSGRAMVVESIQELSNKLGCITIYDKDCLIKAMSEIGEIDEAIKQYRKKLAEARFKA